MYIAPHISLKDAVSNARDGMRRNGRKEGKTETRGCIEGSRARGQCNL